MTAYTEKNFDACLDAISAIRSHRDAALRIADALLKELYPCTDSFCNCDICLLKKQLDALKVSVITYQKGIQQK
jgi:hypothetical protein